MRKRELAGKPPAAPDVSGIYKDDRIDFGPQCGIYYFPQQPAGTNASSCVNQDNTITNTQSCARATYPAYIAVALRQVVGALMPVAENIMRTSTASSINQASIEKCLRCISRTSSLDQERYCLGSDLNDGNYCSASYALVGAMTDMMAILSAPRRAVASYASGQVSPRFERKLEAIQSGWLMAGSYFYSLTNPKLRGEKLAGTGANPRDNASTNFRFTIDYPKPPPNVDQSANVLANGLAKKLGPDFTNLLKLAYKWLGVSPDFSRVSLEDVGTEANTFNENRRAERRYYSFLNQAKGIYTGLSIGVKETVDDKAGVGTHGENLATLIETGLQKPKKALGGINQLIYNLIQAPVKAWVDVNIRKKDRIGYQDPISVLREVGMVMVNSAVVFFQDATQKIFRSLTTAAAAIGGSLVVLATGLGFLGALGNALMQASSTTATVTFQIIMAKFLWYLPLGVAISVPILVMGLSMSVYTPMIPYIIFTFASIGWLISVIEAMVAAPLVALGITHPEGHDLMGKAEQALMLLLSVFVRPAAILMGFIFGIILSFASLNLLNEGFFQVMVAQIKAYETAPNQLFSVGSINLFIGMGSLMIIYTMTVMGVVNQCFSLIYLLPAKLLRWIGGPMDDQAQVIAQLQQQVQSGFKDQAQQMGGGGGQMVSGMKGTVSPPQQGKAFRMKNKREGVGASDNKGDGGNNQG